MCRNYWDRERLENLNGVNIKVESKVESLNKKYIVPRRIDPNAINRWRDGWDVPYAEVLSTILLIKQFQTLVLIIGSGLNLK